MAATILEAASVSACSAAGNANTREAGVMALFGG